MAVARFRALGLLFIGIIATLLASARARAADRSALAGAWNASGMTVAWNFGDWGEACGPKPDSNGAPAGLVQVSAQGSELVLRGAGRTFSTSECWEQYPGLVRTSHVASARDYRTVCKTAPADPRQASVITTITVSDDYMTLDETGQYQFVVRGQNCTASVRRSRSFRRVLAAPPSSAPALSAAAPAASARSTGNLRCVDPGPPAKLEVRPARKLMRPGESFVFRSVVSDRDGCVLPLATRFRLENPLAGVSVSPGGKIDLSADAKEGELSIVVTAAGRSVHVAVEVASSEKYAALLEMRGFTAEGESQEAAITAIASSAIGARAEVSSVAANGRRNWFIAVVGGAALLLGVLGLILVFRGRRRQAAGASAADDAADLDPALAVPRPSRNFCPTCREEYGPDAQFCPLDGNRLLPSEAEASARGPAGGVCPACGKGFDPGVTSCPKHDEELVPFAVYRARLSQVAELARICPICGTQYPGDGRFCGRDGAALVPMN